MVSMPALLTRMSTGPSSLHTRSNMGSTSVRLDTSAFTDSARPPLDRTYSATSSASASLSRKLTATWAPWSAKVSAMPRPIPRPAPVTTATLFLSLTNPSLNCHPSRAIIDYTDPLRAEMGDTLPSARRFHEKELVIGQQQLGQAPQPPSVRGAPRERNRRRRRHPGPLRRRRSVVARLRRRARQLALRRLHTNQHVERRETRRGVDLSVWRNRLQPHRRRGASSTGGAATAPSWRSTRRRARKSGFTRRCRPCPRVA